MGNKALGKQKKMFSGKLPTRPEKNERTKNNLSRANVQCYDYVRLKINEKYFLINSLCYFTFLSFSFIRKNIY